MKQEEVAKGNMNTNEKEITLKDLDPNDYYTIKIYGDYNLEDEKGLKRENEMGQGVFTTLPIASLGYVRYNMELTEITTNKASLKINIDDNITDERLIKIISQIELRLVPEGTENKEEDTKTIEITKTELEKLKIGEEIQINNKYLKSNTKYNIQIITKAKQGTLETEVTSSYGITEITTLKVKAEVQIRNQFVTGEMIDFDIRIDDIDNAILTKKGIIELRNEKQELIIREEINTNEEYDRKTYNKLEENKIYYLKIYANEYNEGNTDETYKSNYLISEKQIYTEMSITGKLDLISIENKATGKNLINVESENNWYIYPNFNTGDYYGKEYNKEANELKLGGNNNARRCVYNLQEYAGQEVTISFKIKYVDINNAGSISIQNAKTDKNRTRIDNITGEYTEKQYTLKLDESGYLGFYVGRSGVYIKDLQIELGNTKTNYEKFEYKTNAKININLEDRKQEITTKDYYMRIYENEEQILEKRYEEINEQNKVENSIKEYEIKDNAKYKIELLIKIRDRYYILSKQSFETETGKEIKGI